MQFLEGAIIVDVVFCAIYCMQLAAIFAQSLQAFQPDEKYSRSESVAAMNIFHHVGKRAIIAQQLQHVSCNKLHINLLLKER